eukprot:1265829-Amphidinium_carterae.2
MPHHSELCDLTQTMGQHEGFHMWLEGHASACRFDSLSAVFMLHYHARLWSRADLKRVLSARRAAMVLKVPKSFSKRSGAIAHLLSHVGQDCLRPHGLARVLLIVHFDRCQNRTVISS